jgi:hypothetical protein
LQNKTNLGQGSLRFTLNSVFNADVREDRSVLNKALGVHCSTKRTM